MNINATSPSFCGKLTDLKTNMNAKKVCKMLSPAYATVAEKYEDGSFVVKGYNTDDSFTRETKPRTIYDDTSIWDEEGLECFVEYTPENGLYSEFRSQDYDDVFYTITQKHGDEPKVEPVETEITLPNRVLNINESFIERMQTVFGDIDEIYARLGTFIPTLENLKL